MDEGETIPAEKNIGAYLYCTQCLKEKPAGIRLREYQRLEAGFTSLGLQIWCMRHESNIIHIDFEGAAHNVNVEAYPNIQLYN